VRWLRRNNDLVRHGSVTSKKSDCSQQSIILLLIILHLQPSLGTGNSLIDPQTELQDEVLTLITKTVVKWLALLPRIQKVQGSSLLPHTSYPD
jgi:hypothetical protein